MINYNTRTLVNSQQKENPIAYLGIITFTYTLFFRKNYDGHHTEICIM